MVNLVSCVVVNEIKSVRDCSIYDPDQFINRPAEYVEVNL